VDEDETRADDERIRGKEDDGETRGDEVEESRTGDEERTRSDEEARGVVDKMDDIGGGGRSISIENDKGESGGNSVRYCGVSFESNVGEGG
jgi:hypothetical protein